ncbi:DUF883 family protein [Stutzerimonas kirkiae]|uniref:DUF883 domain-containing protein n=1 Tax=Stutzerimonas kirkiae TaxID=2211392 RepID=A0A4Q9REL7_9GAMM|nr:DUF883 domain-containing protein [Stutzerimonas kirkiae]TBV05757.1 DUF883 domain-containing protein [Stutzerimonas kirkiae]TBV09552.1 DUF883 domain-containing protein [Stutzerimonas kirkiae]TBV17366.1 DUF883 domain-containing protein [Stutzerimonas kirkiae]
MAVESSKASASKAKKAVEDAVDEVLEPSRPLIDKEAHRRNLQNAQSALIDEFHTLIADTERLLQYTQETAGEQSEELRDKVNENLARARELIKETESSVRDQGQVALQNTEQYIQDNPWKSIGIAAGVGFLVGLLTRR